ncbi:MAG: type II 3-dehydroquinate dehydratase [Moraxella sp.]|nr:type II 3-dehydroquinate dehydratase [Moraxella sp.]
MTKNHLLIINGANLHLLGKREPHIYGTTTLTDIQNRLSATAQAHGIRLSFIQSNHEGMLVDTLGQMGHLGDDSERFDGVIINPAGFTHTSVVLRDALLACDKPFIEVHLSNIHARESFRHHSYFSDKAIGVICGLGDMGYDMALQWFLVNLYGKNA